MLGVKKHAIGDAVLANERKAFHNKCHLINNWIALNDSLVKDKEAIRVAKRAELGIGQDSFVIVSVGGCSSVKNHGFIIDLVKTLANEGHSVTYLHVGTGIDEEAEKTKVRELGLSSQIIFTGNRNDVPALLVCADVYLMPSLFEGLSIALLEAMYYNGLVVVNNAPGLNNMVDNNVTGFVADIENPQNYIDLLKKMINKELDTDAIKEASRTFIEDNFAMEKNAREMVKYYKMNTKFN
jgi:glycosyltransferase involved in cell wall biosynthesis